MPKEGLLIYEVRDLAKKVRKIDTAEAYLDFHDSHFTAKGSASYVEAVKKVFANTNNPPDYFRLLGLVGVLGFQYGFTYLTRQLHRHRQKGWTGSPFDSAHLLALTCYLGRINTQAFPIKQDFAKQLAPVDQDAAVGVWNIKLPVSNAQVYDQKSATLQFIREEALARLSKNVPILMPIQQINERLAAINFTAQDAETMQPDVFERTVLPKASLVLRWFMNPDLAFQNFRQRAFPIPEVDIPTTSTET